MTAEQEAAKKVRSLYNGTIEHVAQEVLDGTATISCIQAIQELADVLGTGDLASLKEKEDAVMRADKGLLPLIGSPSDHHDDHKIKSKGLRIFDDLVLALAVVGIIMGLLYI